MWWIGLGMAVVGSVAAHMILARVAPKQNTVVLAIAAELVVGLTLFVAAWSTFGLLSVEFASTVLIYGAICELYLFLFTLALSSVSANVLVRLATGPKNCADLDSSYDSHGMVEQRFARMEAARLIAREGNRFSITLRGRLIVKAYRGLRGVFRHVHETQTLR
jgi:hypothetical protein